MGKNKREAAAEIYGWCNWRGERGRGKDQSGGMLLGIRKDLVGKECKFEGGVEGMMRDRLRVGGEKWWVIGVYVSGGIEY